MRNDLSPAFLRAMRRKQGGYWQYIIPAATAVLGALGSKGSKNSGTQTTTSLPWAPASPYLEESMRQAQQYGASPMPYGSPQEMVAGLNPLQQAAGGLTAGAVDQTSQLAAAGQAGALPAIRGDYMNVNNNPYLQAAIQAAIRPVTQNFTEQVLPGIRGAFGGTDAIDNSRQGIAEGIASRGYLDSIMGTASTMANQGYQSGMNAQMQALQMIPQLQLAGFQPGQQAWNMGSLLQGQQQRELDARGQYDQMQWQRIANPFNLYSAAARGGQTQMTTTPQPQGNPALGAVGGALTGMQMYDMFNRSRAASPSMPSISYTSGSAPTYTGFDAPF